MFLCLYVSKDRPHSTTQFRFIYEIDAKGKTISLSHSKRQFPKLVNCQPSNGPSPAVKITNNPKVGMCYVKSIFKAFCIWLTKMYRITGGKLPGLL